MNDDSWIYSALTIFILAVVMVIAMGVTAFGNGKEEERAKLLTAYCQSIEYTDYTEIDGLYYCYGSDELRTIEWATK